MDIEKELQKLNKKYQPSESQEERVLTDVFARLENNKVSRPTLFYIFRLTLMKNLLKNKPIVLGVLAAAVVTMFVLPTGILFLTNTDENLSTYEDLQDKPDFWEETTTSNGPLPDIVDRKVVNDNTDSGDAGSKESEDMVIMPHYPGYSSEDTETPEGDRIKNQYATLKFETDDMKADFEAVKSIATEFGGYISQSSLNQKSSSSKKSGYVSIRIPSDKFQLAVDKIYNLDAQITSEELITLDQQNQLNENRETKKSLEEQIAEIEIEIANETDKTTKQRLELRLQGLKDSLKYTEDSISNLIETTSFSTINVYLSEKVNDTGLELGEIKETFLSVLEFWIKAAIICSVPSLIVLGLGSLAWKILMRRNRKKQ